MRIEYTDVFNDTSTTRNTFAYPTKVYDPAGNYSEVKYRHDIGANVWAKSPAPDGNSQGKITERDYDSIGRLSKDKIVNHGGAYRRYEYPNNGIQSKVFSTIIDTNANGADTADEVLSESWSDGAGRVRKSRTEHPGSTGGWSGSTVEYDVLGRAKKQSVPTEISVPNPYDPDTWSPAGDDATRGWLYTYQKYDWMGRVVRKINTDGADSPTLNDSDVLISYDGCGCAGGLVVTVEGELVPRDDQPTLNGRRKQKVYSDILGRDVRTEIYNWDGGVYKTNVTTFNGRDQVTQTRQYAGTTSSTTYQDTTATFDGHGRLKSQHAPQQDAGTGTQYTYNADDRPATVTDARGAVTAYTYNTSGLVTNINHSMPPPNPEGGTGNLTPDCDGSDPCHPLCPNRPPYCDIPQTYSPIGWLDSVNTTNGNASGWSFDPDNSSASNTVHFYIDGPAGSGTYIGQAAADLPRPDINAAYSISGNHGFEFTIPTQYLDGTQHTIYAYGIDIAGGDPNSHLQGSPKTFVPSSPAVIPSLNRSVTFTYDVLGNRTSMTDELGDMQYEYNEMGQITAETRRFNDTMPNAPMSGNRFKLQYEYAMGGRLKSYTDPFGQQFSYERDKRGRLSSVNGSSFGGVTTYADDAEYRAWGGLKKADYSGGVQLEMSYNNSMSASSMALQKTDNSFLVNKNYDYYADGKLSYLQDAIDARFDRLNTYDNAGRIKDGKSGLEARGGVVAPADQEANLPYRQSYAFNAFSNMTQVNNLHWGTSSWQGQNFNQSFTYVNNRIQKPDWLFDGDGRNTKSVADDGETTLKTFDAAGQLVRTLTGHADSVSFYSGQGDEIKRHVRAFNEQTGAWVAMPTKYYIRSSVLKGRVVSEVWGSGKKHRSYVKGIGGQTAVQTAYYTETSPLNESVIFEYSDAMGVSYRTTDKMGNAVAYGDGGEGSPVETDPLGGSVGMSSPYFEEPVYIPQPEYPELQPYSPPDLFAPDFSALYASLGSRVADLPGFGTNWGSFSELGMLQYEERVHNAFRGLGFRTSEELGGRPGARFSGYGLTYPNGRQVGGNWTIEEALGRMEGGEELTLHWDEDWNIFPDHKPWYVVGFTEAQFKVVNDQVKSMYGNEKCKKAFEAAGLRSVTSMMNSGGSLTLVHDSVMKDESQRESWAPDTNLSSQMKEAFQDPYASGITPPGGYKGNFYVGLRDRTFNGSDDTAVNIIIHELIHAGSVNGSGVGNKDTFRIEDRIFYNGKTGFETSRSAQFIDPRSNSARDLSWMNYKDGKYTGAYDAIIKACQPK